MFILSKKQKVMHYSLLHAIFNKNNSNRNTNNNHFKLFNI